MDGGARQLSQTPGIESRKTPYDERSCSRLVTSGTERVQSVRKVSSTILSNEYVGARPKDLPTREVEVQGPIQEIVKHVTKKETVETEKRVPRYEYEWVDKIVEVPRIEYVDKTVEIPQYQEVIREVKVPQIIEVPKEVVREVRVPKVNYVEQVRQVPGQVIEVPKPYTVENKVEVARYTDNTKALIVAQTVKPTIVESDQVCQVEVLEVAPQCIPVDVHVVKAVSASVSGSVSETSHRVVTVPAAQYNTMLQQLNTHLPYGELEKLPYMTDASGNVPFLSTRATYVEAQASTHIEGYVQHKIHNAHVHSADLHTTSTTMPVTSSSGFASAVHQHLGPSHRVGTPQTAHTVSQQHHQSSTYSAHKVHQQGFMENKLGALGANIDSHLRHPLANH